MTNLYTLAYEAKKPKKAEAQEIIEEIYNNCEALTDYQRQELTKVYKYFMPAKVKKPKSVFEWLSLACSTEAVRPYIHFIWCDGQGNAIATNGHILLRAPCAKPIGFYDAQGHKIEHDHTFPDWRRVFPDRNTQQTINPTFERIGPNTIAFEGHESLAFNSIYFEQIMSYGGNNNLYWNKDGFPLLVDFNDGRQALIMPLRK